MNLNNKKFIKVMTKFLVALIFLTFFSRTIYQFNLPVVTAQLAANGMLEHRIEGNSLVKLADNTNVRSETSGRINNILVRNGQEISYGQVIAEVDPDLSEISSTEISIKEKQHDLDMEVFKLNNLQLESSSSSIELYRKQISNKQLIERNEENIQKLTEEIEILENEIINIENKPLDTITKSTHEHNINIATQNLSTNQILFDQGIISRSELDEFVNALRDAETNYEKYVQEANNTKQDEIRNKRDEINDKNNEIRKLKDEIDKDNNDLNDTIFDFEQTALEEQREANINIMEANHRINILKLEIVDLQRKLEQQKTTTIVSKSQGIVSDIKVEVGQQVGIGDVVLETLDSQSEYKVEIEVNNKQLEKITPESEVTISVRGISNDFRGEIISVEPIEDNQNQFNLIILIDNQDLDLKDRNANIIISTPSIVYDTIIPNEALRSDSDGNFILVLREEDNVLGNQYVAHKVNVNLIDADNRYTAIERILNPEPIIVSSTSPINNGSRVRYVE